MNVVKSAIDLTDTAILRDVTGAYIETIGEMDERVVVVNADLMVTCRNRGFVEAYPHRAFNVGIAEQNQVSFAAGLAHEGFVPFVFSMSQFMSMRACEQCRTDVAYGNLNVRFVTTYAGVSGGISGATHWAIEDVAIMTAMPNMAVVELSDKTQAKRALEYTLTHEGPIYFRSSVEPAPKIYGDDYVFDLNQADLVIPGDDGAIIASGITVKYAIEAARHLREESGKSVRVIDMHTIKPIDRKAVIDAAATGTIVVAQDHVKYGGLGSVVASVLAEEKMAGTVNFEILGIPDTFATMAHAPYLYHAFGYDAQGIQAAVSKYL